MKIPEKDTLCVYCGTDLSKRDAMNDVVVAAKKSGLALEDLYAMVKGECPSLLNEDSGGSARTDMLCSEAIEELRVALKKREEGL